MPKIGFKHSEASKEKMRNTPKPRGDKNFWWKGGRQVTDSGYILLFSPNHPFAHKRYVKEHRLVMEKHLGRYLTKDEVVHHINGVRDDNRIENLHLMTNSSHQILHGLARTPKKQTKRPPARKEGLIWIDVKNDYRKYVVGKCRSCGRLFWHRKDHPTKCCSPDCSEKFTGNGKKLHKQYGHLGPKVRWG
jgi:uncharacterized protein (DUF1330 family)